MLKGINYYLWYLYFSLYWSCSNWGAKRPQSNAIGILNVTVFLNFGGFYEISEYFGYKFSETAFFTFCIIPAFLIPYFLFQRKQIFRSKLKDFEYLKSKEYNRKRIIVMVSVMIFSMLFFDGMAVVRHLTHSL